jgi:hypothetical protein
MHPTLKNHQRHAWLQSHTGCMKASSFRAIHFTLRDPHFETHNNEYIHVYLYMYSILIYIYYIYIYIMYNYVCVCGRVHQLDVTHGVPFSVTEKKHPTGGGPTCMPDERKNVGCQLALMGNLCVTCLLQAFLAEAGTRACG